MGKKLKFGDLFAIGLGFTVGSGVFSLTGVAAMYTGGSAFVAYLIGAIMIYFMRFPVILAGSVVPRQGVSYSLTKESYGNSMGGFWFWIFFIGRIAMLANATAFAIYFTSVFTTLNPKIVAGVIIVVFYLANFFGLQTAAKAQKVLNLLMLAAFLTFIVVGSANINTVFVFNQENFARGAVGGFFSAVSTVVFCMGGGTAMLELGGVTEDAERNLPKVTFLITMLSGLVFAGIAFATVGALELVPMPDGAGMAGTLLFGGPAKSVINAAEAIFANMPPLFYFFIFCGTCMAAATTINGSFGWYATPVQAAIEDGWFPRWFGKPNRYGSPYRIQAIYALVTVVSLFFFSTQSIGSVNTNVIKTATNLQIIADIIPNFALLCLPRLYPEVWEKSRWHMGRGALMALFLLSTGLSVFLWALNFKGLAGIIQTVLLGLFVIGAFYALIGGKTFAKKEKRG